MAEAEGSGGGGNGGGLSRTTRRVTAGLMSGLTVIATVLTLYWGLRGFLENDDKKAVSSGPPPAR